MLRFDSKRKYERHTLLDFEQTSPAKPAVALLSRLNHHNLSKYVYRYQKPLPSLDNGRTVCVF